MTPEPLIAITTASFLPATACAAGAIRRAADFAKRNGFAGIEVLVTRAVVRAWRHGGLRADLPFVSFHETWNPKRSLSDEVRRIVLRVPQSRGMVPYPMACIFFGNSDVSEAAMFGFAEQSGAVAVVSQLASPVTGTRYGNARAAVQVHPDLGPDGAFLPLETVADELAKHDYPVVLDTYHVRRRVRQFVDGKTEINPPPAGPGERSLGGIRRVWAALGERVRLVHFQAGIAPELAIMLAERRLPPALVEFAELLPELARRRIPIVIEASPVVVAAACRNRLRAMATGKGLWGSEMPDAILRIRDALLSACAG